MFEKLRFMLLQVRDHADPMRLQEVQCFLRSLRCEPHQLATFDLLAGAPNQRELACVDVVLIGGSGDYSVVTGGNWLPPASDTMRELSELSKATFASCWGFQALASALGGNVVTDVSRAELGTHTVTLTSAGRLDPVFGSLDLSFPAQMGHQDIVDRLPPNATLLASTPRVVNQAFVMTGKPIYGTQFHSELRCADFLMRIRSYPAYIETIAGMPLEEFIATCRETPTVSTLPRQFVDWFLAQDG